MTRASEHAQALEQLGRSFKAAMAAVRRLRGRDTHRAGQLGYAQYALLFALDEQRQLSAGDLACAADLAPATVTQMLDSLADAGLVERVRSEQDKRVVLTSLTATGRALIAERRGQIEPRWRSALADFSDAELRTTAAVLDRLRSMFDEFAEYPVTVEQPARTRAANRRAA